MAAATPIDATFRALADPTRRQLIELLCVGPASMTELLGSFSITLPSLSKHLGILESSGLVLSSKRGRVRTFQVRPGALAVAEQWLSRQRTLWERRLDQLDEHLKTLKEQES